MSDAEAFEKAIIANPDERATYSAYADWLQERDDPRGEFIAVQLALEDESRSKEDREELKQRERKLLGLYEEDWLGGLAAHSVRENYTWRRGFLDTLTIPDLTMAFAQALATAPVAKFVRTLRLLSVVRYYAEARYGRPADPTPTRPTPTGQRDHYAHFELIGTPALQSVRVFYLGDEEAELPEDGWGDCHTYAPGLHHLVAEMPNVEELHLLCKDYESADLFALPNLTNLRVLRMYHLGGYDYQRRYEYALETLAQNPAFANLTHLLFHPHYAEGDGSYLPLEQVRELLSSPHLKKLTHLQLRLSDMGDDGIREIIASGILNQLKWLDLRHGCVTDEGARLLAACPDAARLERLDLSYNGVTATGLAALRAAKVNAVANNPLTQAELDDREYLRQGDFE